MSETSSPKDLRPSETPPRIVYGEDAHPAISIDSEAIAQTMYELGIPSEDISKTTIYIDPSNRYLNNGTEYPASIGRLRFRGNPEMRKSEGSVIRLTTQKRGEPRPEELMNRTLVHELEHVAQSKRKDPKIFAGYAAMLGMAAAGAFIGSKLGKSREGKAAGTALGFLAGRYAGYMLAPHEKQARERARNVKSTAIRRNQPN